MNEISRSFLLLSMQRALLGNVHPALRQASIEADQTKQLVRLRFEYSEDERSEAKELCSIVAAEIISDLPREWNIEEEHESTSNTKILAPLEYVAYRRFEA